MITDSPSAHIASSMSVKEHSTVPLHSAVVEMHSGSGAPKLQLIVPLGHPVVHKVY